MNILAIDTSTKKANVCLQYKNKIINKSIDNEITHSEKLLPLIDEVIKSENTNLKEMDYLACSDGPGSFTGIRIGIATVKAFSKTFNIPVFNVSSLDILAYTNTNSDYVISIMDAKNNRVYYSLYKIAKQNYNTLSIPYLVKICDYSNDIIDIALEKLQQIIANEKTCKNTSINIIGDCVEKYKDLFITKLSNNFEEINHYTTSLSSEVLITMVNNYINLGIEKDYTNDYLTLDAIYVRPSQAERAKNNEI